VPDDPADIEAAALDMIARMPATILGADAPPLAALQALCGLLQAESAFAGLSWSDARQVAAAVSFDACCRDDAAASLRGRVASVADGTDSDGMAWADRQGGSSPKVKRCRYTWPST
jgi:hypothetical protein